MLTCFDVADFFLALSEKEIDAGEGITNLKLQKMVYYAQGFSLALFGKPLFDAPIEAWAHGPVVPDLYHCYKSCGSEPIPAPKDFDFDKFDQDTRKLLTDVYVVYGQFSAWKLRNLTHQEAPWIDAYEGPGTNNVISHESMKKYFITQLTDEERS
ncbi:MAG: SocA family protein [Deltaproteobacteria bacterium]|nr:SocA family protein [Deltaproteobacteria bacterium]